MLQQRPHGIAAPPRRTARLRSTQSRLIGILLAAATCAACTGKIGKNEGSSGGVDPNGGALSVGATGLRRLSRNEYDNTLRDLLGDTTRSGYAKLPEDVNDPFDNDYTTQLASGALIERPRRWRRTRRRARWPIPREARRARRLHADGPGDAACLRAFVRAFGRRALRRPLADAEVAALPRAVVVRGRGEGLLRRRRSGAARDAAGPRVPLPGRDRRAGRRAPRRCSGSTTTRSATRLSYFLWGSTPPTRCWTWRRPASSRTADGRRAAALSDARRSARPASASSGSTRFWLGYHQLPHRARHGDADARRDRRAGGARRVRDARPTTSICSGRPRRSSTTRWPTHYGLPAPGSTTGAWVAYGDEPAARHPVARHACCRRARSSTTPAPRCAACSSATGCSARPSRRRRRTSTVDEPPTATSQPLQGRPLRRAPQRRLRHLPQPDRPDRLRPRELRPHRRLPHPDKDAPEVPDQRRRRARPASASSTAPPGWPSCSSPAASSRAAWRSSCIRFAMGRRETRRRPRDAVAPDRRVQAERTRVRRAAARRGRRPGVRSPPGWSTMTSKLSPTDAAAAARAARRSRCRCWRSCSTAAARRTRRRAATPKRYVVCFDGQSLGGDGDPLHNDYVPNTVGANYDLKIALAPLAAACKDEVTRRLGAVRSRRANGGAVPAGGRRDDFHVVVAEPAAVGRPLAVPTPRRRARRRISSWPTRSPARRRSSRWSTASRRSGTSRVSAPYGRDMISYKANASGGTPLRHPADGQPQAGVRRAVHQLHAARRRGGGRAPGLPAAQPQERAGPGRGSGPSGCIAAARHAPTSSGCSGTSTRSATSSARVAAIAAARRPATCQKPADPGADPALGRQPGVDAAGDNTYDTTSATAARRSARRCFVDLMHMAMACDLTRVGVAAVHDVPVAHEHVPADRAAAATCTRSATAATRPARGRWASARASRGT